MELVGDSPCTSLGEIAAIPGIPSYWGVRCWEREERGENLDRKGEGKWAVTSVRGTTNELISKK